MILRDYLVYWDYFKTKTKQTKKEREKKKRFLLISMQCLQINS